MFEYLQQGRCIGPITGTELLDLVETGVLGPDDLVRRTRELAFRTVREMLALLHADEQLAASRPPPRLSSSGRPSTGGYTVFTSAPPIPPNPVPKLDSLACRACGVALSTPGDRCASCTAKRRTGKVCGRCAQEHPRDARFCGGCGRELS